MREMKTEIRQFLLDNFLMAGNAAIADDASFMKGHVLDSSGFMELVLFIEETFGIKVEDKELLPENLDSLNNIEAFLIRRGAANGAGR